MSTILNSEQRAKTIRSTLRTLRTSSEHIQSCAVVSFDGLLIAAVLDDGVDGDRFGAMCASLLALSTRAAKEVNRGILRQIVLDGEQGPMLLTRAGSVGVLAVAARSSAHLGRLLFDARATAETLAALGDASAT
jgi:predicted regulator of Ras-like GTPase activity (Roadblock/LC7/MglB family)